MELKKLKPEKVHVSIQIKLVVYIYTGQPSTIMPLAVGDEATSQIDAICPLLSGWKVYRGTPWHERA